LELEASVRTGDSDQPRVELQFYVEIPGAAETASARLSQLAEASTSLRTAELPVVESGMAVAWQLVQALGGKTQMSNASADELIVTVELAAEVKG
jgi:hypothetical protein